MTEEQTPEFGPGGYLPERAARRARKIILRAPLGLQWIIATVVAGVVVVVAGVLFLASTGGPPDEPWVAVGRLEALDPATVPDSLEVLMVTAAGRPRAFPDAGERGLTYCARTRRIESADGGVWTLTGRGLGGADSLAQHPTLVHDGVVYVDPTERLEPPPPSDEPAEPVCTG